MFSRIFDYRIHQDNTFPDGVGPTSGPPGGTGGVPGLTGWDITTLPCYCDTDANCVPYSGAPYTIEGQSTSISCCCDETAVGTVEVFGEIKWYKNGILVYLETFTESGFYDESIELTVNYTYWDDTGSTVTLEGSYATSISYISCPVIIAGPPSNYFPTGLDTVTSCAYAINCNIFSLNWISTDTDGPDSYEYRHRFRINVEHDNSRCCNSV